MKKIFTGILILSLAFAGTAIAKNTSDHKTAICHRTASDSNPYDFITVDNNSLDAHFHNDKHGHPARYWKSDGTFRGISHSKGDPKNDYPATSKSDCEDFPTPTETPSPTQTPAPTPTVAPTPTPCEDCVPATQNPPTPTPTIAPTPSVEPTPSPSETPTETPSPTETPTPTETPVTPTDSPSPTDTPTITLPPTDTE